MSVLINVIKYDVIRADKTGYSYMFFMQEPVLIVLKSVHSEPKRHGLAEKYQLIRFVPLFVRIIFAEILPYFKWFMCNIKWT